MPQFFFFSDIDNDDEEDYHIAAVDDDFDNFVYIGPVHIINPCFPRQLLHSTKERRTTAKFQCPRLRLSEVL